MSEEESGEQVTINIVNTGAETLWVDAVGCQGIPAFFVADSEGNEVQVANEMCPIPLCDDLLAGECDRSCLNCLPPSGVRLEPGAKFGMIWSGDNLANRDMTAECAPGEGCAGECVVGYPRPAGLYEITVTAYLECSGDCACEPSNPEDLWCHTQDDISTSQPLVVTVPFDYPKVTDVEVKVGA
ncbi:hypothetical protein [Nannocystis pusilla]|uniref:hypothetical protein n=1 Tax=Nannocystis pusilla TaxID=889268 RepID=UPI003BEF740F